MQYTAVYVETQHSKSIQNWKQGKEKLNWERPFKSRNGFRTEGERKRSETKKDYCTKFYFLVTDSEFVGLWLSIYTPLYWLHTEASEADCTKKDAWKMKWMQKWNEKMKMKKKHYGQPWGSSSNHSDSATVSSLRSCCNTDHYRRSFLKRPITIYNDSLKKNKKSSCNLLFAFREK